MARLPLYGQVEFGMKGGGNLSKIGGDYQYYKTKLRLGVQGGVVANLPVHGNISLRPELLFSQKGGRIDFTAKNGMAQAAWKFTGIQRINYLEFPVHIDFKSPIDKDRSLVFSLGVYGAVGVGGSLSLKNDHTDFRNPYYSKVVYYSMPIQFKNSLTVEDQLAYNSQWEQEFGFVKQTDFGGKMGIGFRVPLAFFELSYTHGFADINRQIEVAQTKQILKNTQSIQFNITFFPTSVFRNLR